MKSPKRRPAAKPGSSKRTSNGRPKISVRKTKTVRTGKSERQVMEKYTPTGKGKKQTGFTVTKKTAAARNAAQVGSSHRSDKTKVARAPGRRSQVGRGGKNTVYYENRENRSDADKRKFK